MRTLFLLAAITAPTVSLAECPVSFSAPEHSGKVIAIIQEAESCYEAAKIAESCAYGSTVDIMIAGAASEVCTSSATLLDMEGQAAYNTLVSACGEKYGQMTGTMWRSAAAFCALNAAQAISSAYTPMNTGF